MNNQIGATVDKMRIKLRVSVDTLIILGADSLLEILGLYRSSHSGYKTYELYKEGK